MSSGGLRIGAVAERIGVPAATLRTWEWRYQVTTPQRSSGRDRRYSDDDVARLAHIVALRENGERVADLAHLSLDELTSRRARYEPVPTPRTDAPLRVALLGALTHDDLGGPTSDGRATLSVEVRHATLLEELPAVDAVVVDVALLGDDPAATLRQARWTWGGAVLLVAYHFAPTPWLDALMGEGARTVRMPLSTLDLQAAIVDAVLARRQAGAWPEPVLSRAQLQALQQLRPKLACECPDHLASLSLALSQFEAYARSCAVRSPEDAALHRRLALGTRRARGVMEDLLRQVCEEEGIDWPAE